MEVTQEILDKLSKHDSRHYLRTGQLILTSDYGDKFGVIKAVEPVTETVVIEPDEFKVAEPVVEKPIEEEKVVEPAVEEPIEKEVIQEPVIEPDEFKVAEPVIEEPVVEVEKVAVPVVEKKTKK